MYALMSFQFPLLSECLIAHITGVLALLFKVGESVLLYNRKKDENPSREIFMFETTEQQDD
jgi:hypothetical protein